MSHLSPLSFTPPRRALITGASRGLGLALVRELTALGTTVAGIARGEKALTTALAPLGALALPADLGSDNAEAIAARALALAKGPFDLVIHAAGTLGPLQGGEDPMPRLCAVDAVSLGNVFDVNTLGPARLIRALVRSMRSQGGRVVVVSSDAALAPYAGWGAYGASKLALDHLMRVWTLEEPRVGFSSFDPGEMNTAMHAAAFPAADRAGLKSPSQAAAELLASLAEEPTLESSPAIHSHRA